MMQQPVAPEDEQMIKAERLPPEMAALLDALPEAAILIDASGRVAKANSASVELFGGQLQDALLRAHLRQPEPAAALDQALAQIDDNSRSFEARLVQLSPTSEHIWQMIARPLPRESGFRMILVTFHDISHREVAEAQRRDFVANVSHELRSPLTVLTGFIETLQGPADNDPVARRQFLEIMQREAERMTGLVADLLSLSRVESNEKVRPRDTVALGDVLRATLAALRPQIESAGLTTNLLVPDDLPPVIGDRDQLVQVFHNLIENAVKYGSGGHQIDIRVDSLPSFPGIQGPALRVSVTDYGDGIDPIHIPRLTERFYRIDGARSREKGGTGLGLAIVKHILNRHRARLLVRSTPSEGSTFETILPVS